MYLGPCERFRVHALAVGEMPFRKRRPSDAPKHWESRHLRHESGKLLIDERAEAECFVNVLEGRVERVMGEDEDD